MINPHPPLSGFPIVLLVLAALTQFYSDLSQKAVWGEFSFRMLVIAVIISPFTFFSGYWGAEVANQSFTVPEEAILNHESVARIFLFCLGVTLSLAIVSRRARQAKMGLNVAYRVVLAGTALMVLYLGFLGGELVFRYGAGVSAENSAK